MWTYLYFYLPETKGRNIEDITTELKEATSRRESSHAHVQS
jgi:hypothetical protein